MSSKADVFDLLAKKNSASNSAASAQSSDVFDRLSKEKPQISKLRSVLSAPVKGALKGAEQLGQLGDPVKMIVNQLTGQNPNQLAKLTEQVLPTRDETTEQILERAGTLAPSAAIGGGGIVPTLLSIAGGTTLGHIAKEEGIGETGQGVAEAVGMGLPGLVKAGGKALMNLFKSPVEKLPSGIVKPRALGAKFAEKGVITPERQEKALNQLNKQASELTKQTVQKELPIAKRIEQGFDFEGSFDKRFGALEKIAENANPRIDVSNLPTFLAETSAKYEGIPKLHAEAEKIMSEVNAAIAHPQDSMKNLLRIYRSNNRKVRGIYETSRLTGRQQEYVDFLSAYNREIGKSFENTLPKESGWLKEFKGLNSEYKQYKDALKTLNELEGVLGQKATPANITKLAHDAKLHKKLSLSMGEKGANEVSQIAKDLKDATEAIKRIPARDVKWYEAILPFSILIPGVKIPGGAVAAKKGLDFARRGYGWFLSTPKRRAVYDDILKGLINDSRSQFVKGAEELEKLLKEDENQE